MLMRKTVRQELGKCGHGFIAPFLRKKVMLHCFVVVVISQVIVCLETLESIEVSFQPIHVLTVHQYARVVCPCGTSAVNGVNDLLALKDLLVESTGVEGLGALKRILKGYEYLHISLILSNLF